jgi:hypothetical protein
MKPMDGTWYIRHLMKNVINEAILSYDVIFKYFEH